jgi:nucleoid-associated protein YgaU
LSFPAAHDTFALFTKGMQILRTTTQPRTYCLVALTFLTAACDQFSNAKITSPDQMPEYRRARQAADAGDSRVAVALYQKVLRQAPDAARVHLELGVLYDEKLNDPVAALYHYRQYLELEPNSDRRPVVQGFIDRAKQAVAAHIAPAGTDAAELARIQTEKAGLMQENAALRARVLELESAGGVSGPTIVTQIVTQVVTQPPVPANPPAAMRTHVVQPKETLYSIATQYYGSPAGWEKIFAANRTVLASKDQLKVGQKLTIP